MENSKDSKKENIKGILGAGAIILPNPIHRKALRYSNKIVSRVGKVKDPKLLEENRKIANKLSKTAANQGTLIEGLTKKKFNGSYNIDHRLSQVEKKELRNIIKDQQKELISDWEKFNNDPGNRKLKDSIKTKTDKLRRNNQILESKDFIKLNKNSKTSGITLSHELGHSRHFHGRGGSRIGKVAHDLRSRIGGIESGISEISGIRPHELSNAGGTILGLASGINAGRKEAKGEKEGIVSKTSILAPLAIKTPQLVSEFEASRQGMKMLKNASASKKYRKLAGKSLASMLGTYAADALTPVALGYGARQVGRLIGKKIGREELEKKNKK